MAREGGSPATEGVARFLDILAIARADFPGVIVTSVVIARTAIFKFPKLLPRIPL